MAALRVRRDVWKLGAKDETLVWYGRAIAAMQKRPLTDPTSWRYQAAIHDHDDDPAQDPLHVAGEKLPADRETYWKQCQHGTWFFLPWHRMYLHYFEQIVCAAVVQLGGPPDWALPYWNYSDKPAAAVLPPAFRAGKLADGSPNPLYVEARAAGVNAGGAFADHHDTDIAACLKDPVFANNMTGSAAGFGGPATQFHHDPGVVGLVEATPHGSMHNAVGGWMGSFNTAPLDPIFWLHHANIDRLWEVWRHRAQGDTNPTDAAWLAQVAFPFHDAQGKAVTMTSQQVLDPTAAPLFYRYDDIHDPIVKVKHITPPPKKAATPPHIPPELLGATDAPTPLDEQAASHASFPVALPTAPGREAFREAATSGHKVFLNLEHVTATGKVPPYDVYVNVPEGADPSAHRQLFVGRMPLFGVAESARKSATHHGGGLHYVFDISDTYRGLAAQAHWDPTKLRVSFVPVRAGAGATVHVGRISLYVQ